MAEQKIVSADLGDLYDDMQADAKLKGWSQSQYIRVAVRQMLSSYRTKQFTDTTKLLGDFK